MCVETVKIDAEASGGRFEDRQRPHGIPTDMVETVEKWTDPGKPAAELFPYTPSLAESLHKNNRAGRI